MYNKDISQEVDNVFNNISKNIKHQRISTNMTQEDFAEAIGVSSQYVSQLERGESTPSLKLLLTICFALNCSIYDLIPQNKYDFDNSLDAAILQKLSGMSSVKKDKLLSFIDWYNSNHND